MPINPIGDEPHLKRLGLRNYWGYNPINFFAIEPRYAAVDARAEFRALVDTLHDAGIELILDVVFNHTAEGDAFGPTLSYRGIDNASYYWLMPDDPQRYLNYTGVGNTLNVQHPVVRDLVLDSLRFWARLGVDGFRFDLASVLARTEGLTAAIACGPGAVAAEVDRRTLGCERGRLPVGRVSAALAGVERSLPRFGAPLLARRSGTSGGVRVAHLGIERHHGGPWTACEHQLRHRA